MIIFTISLFITVWLLTSVLTNAKSAVIISISSIILALIIHGISYVLTDDQSKAEIIMWSIISIPNLALVLNVAVSMGFIIVRVFIFLWQRKNRRK